MSLSLLSIPKELRLDILSYLLPTHTTICLRPARGSCLHPAKCCSQAAVPSLSISTSNPTRCGTHVQWSIATSGTTQPLSINTAVFLVCRQMRDEAISQLYDTNVFTFIVGTARESWPRMPSFVSRCGWPTRHPHHGYQLKVNTFTQLPPETLRLIRKAEIVVQENLSDKDRYLQAQRRMADIASRIQEHGSFKQLTVTLKHGQHRRVIPANWEFQVHPDFLQRDTFSGVGSYKSPGVPPAGDVSAAFQYCLEPLAQVRGIPVAKIQGHVKNSFAKELSAAMQRRRGSKNRWTIPRRAYKIEKKLRKMRGKARRQRVVESTRFYYEPELDWDAEKEADWPDDRFEDKRRCRLHAIACGCRYRPVSEDIAS